MIIWTDVDGRAIKHSQEHLLDKPKQLAILM